MKKSTLALSIAAAIGGLGMVSNALAITDTANDTGATASASLVRNDNGIGHQLVFPYFTAQNDNVTLLTITNTDTTNGKLVKVRFRGAANSDDLFDFQLALSPGDIWTAAVSKDATTGKAQLATSDKSCTLPASVNATFNTNRVDPSAADTAAQTREGYVEVINMADIKPVANNSTGTNGYTTALYTTIKHVSGVAPCSATVLSAKLSSDATYAVLTGTSSDTNVGLANPTTGLNGDWIILNQKTTAAWSGAATALEVQASGTAGAGKVVFFPQTAGTPGGTLSLETADPLLTSGVVAIQNFDLPDLSTLYTTTPASAVAQATASTAALAVSSVSNQYWTDSSIAAVTDLLFSQPLRRYAAAVNYKANSATNSATGVTTYYPFATTGTIAAAIYQGATGSAATTSTAANTVALTQGASETVTNSSGTAYYSSTNLKVTSSRNLCLNSIAAPANNTIFDREETTPATSSSSTSFVISPSTTSTTPTVYVCGEAAVISINNGGTTGVSALGASIARSDFTSTSLTTYTNGWVKFLTPGFTATGLPILGQSFIRAANGSVNYGIGYSNKVTR